MSMANQCGAGPALGAPSGDTFSPAGWSWTSQKRWRLKQRIIGMRTTSHFPAPPGENAAPPARPFHSRSSSTRFPILSRHPSHVVSGSPSALHPFFPPPPLPSTRSFIFSHSFSIWLASATALRNINIFNAPSPSGVLCLPRAANVSIHASSITIILTAWF